jgi:photosystem II stability/assembly factor-like uncharacterized protein
MVAALILSGVASGARAQTPSLPSEGLLSAFTYRNMGPFRMGARIAAIAVPDSPAQAHLYTIYVAPWTGGLFKTTNNGTTWTPIFDNVSTRLTVGAVAIAHSDPDIVWVGTGDAYTSRSSYAGDGVYKSTDAGKTWQHMGLPETQHIGRIMIDPTNPDIVYVAAMGHLYSTNPERGVFRTRDGGRTWEKVLYIDEHTGVIDLAMNPLDPNVLYAATYDEERFPYRFIGQGPESGIYKTTDGGDHWTRLRGGLPTGQIGRIGISLVASKPDVIYAIIANNNVPPGAKSPADPKQRQPIIGGEVYRSTDAGTTWTKTSDTNVSTKGPYYFNQIFADPNNDMAVWVSGTPGGLSEDGGRTWTRIFRGHFGDNRTFWFDPQDSMRMIIGSDGGIAISYDRGKTGDSYSNLPIGEIYHVAVDNDDPYNIYGGLQDHEQWRGPSTSGFSHGITQHEWFALGDGDGIFVAPDTTNSRWLYVDREYGGQTRLDQKLGYERDIVPQTPSGEAPYRWIWEPPLVISPHDPAVLYTGSQKLLKSTDRGDHWFEISPDLSRNPVNEIFPESEGYGPPGGIPWWAISSISESPITAGVIWTGTSGGKVWLTQDDGSHWADMTAQLTALGARDDGYVTRVLASSHVAGRAYVSKSGYKFDDFRPFLYETEDFGRTWTSISDGLPQEPINVIYEDPRNPDLLYVGDDVGVFISLDRGRHWENFNNNMPNVPVHDLVVQPREGDLVVGSYGRSFWVTNVRALEQLTPDVLASDVHLFTVKPTVQRIVWSLGANDQLFGQRHIQTPNEPSGMVIQYYLKNPAAGDVTVTVTDASGKEVWSATGPGKAGIDTVLWPMGPGARFFAAGARRAGVRGVRQAAPVDPATRMAVNQTPIASAAQGGSFGGTAGTVIDRLPPLGTYTVTLKVGGRTYTEEASIVRTQGWSIGPNPQTIR